VTVLLLEVFMGPAAALPAAVFLGMVVGVLGNFWYLFIFLGVLVRVCPILRFCVLFMFFWFLGFCPILIVLVMSLGSYSFILVLFVAL